VRDEGEGGGRVSGRGEGAGGNREVSPIVLSDERGDLSGAYVGASPKEGGSWGKHGFRHASEPKAREAAA
jgi:hypothetical protein